MDERRMAFGLCFGVRLRAPKPGGRFLKLGHLCSNSHGHGFKTPVLSERWWLMVRSQEGATLPVLPSPVTRHLLLLRVERLLTGLPFRLAETTCLQRLDHSERLLSRTTNIQVMNYFVTQN